MKLPDSDDEVLVLHNPRCSKSRAVLALLQERGIAFTERRYLDAPLTRHELGELRRRLDMAPGEWVRTRQVEYAAAGLTAGSDEDAILDAMSTHPVLMERPIVLRGKRARVGRPPENVLSLFR